MECTPTEKLREGDDWQHEIKFDGYRAIAIKQRGEISLYSRRGNSFNAAYPGVIAALATMRGKSFVFDGELVAVDENGLHSFSLLQHAKSRSVAVRYYVFDLLHLDGENLMSLPLRKRRTALEKKPFLNGRPRFISHH